MQRTCLIIGLGEMAKYLGVSISTVKKYIRFGMPAWFDGSDCGGRWHFYSENVETWFRQKCKLDYSKMKEVPEDTNGELVN